MPRLPQNNSEWDTLDPDRPQPRQTHYPDVTPEQLDAYRASYRERQKRRRRAGTRAWWIAWALGFLLGAIVDHFLTLRGLR
jgi:hypothetical protein